MLNVPSTPIKLTVVELVTPDSTIPYALELSCLIISPVEAVIFAPRVKVFLVIAVRTCLEVITGAAGAFVDL